MNEQAKISFLKKTLYISTIKNNYQTGTIVKKNGKVKKVLLFHCARCEQTIPYGAKQFHMERETESKIYCEDCYKKEQKISRNQQLLLEEFLKEKKRNYIQDEADWEQKKADLRIEEANGYYYKSRFLERIRVICGLSNSHRYNLFESCKDRYFDIGRLFFEWSKEKCKEWKIPVSTFSSLKQTRKLAKWLLDEWVENYKSIEEVIAWFEGEDFCLK